MGFSIGDEGLIGQIVREGDGFDVFLKGRGDLALVAPCVGALEVRGDGEEKVGDLREAGVVFFEDGWGERVRWGFTDPIIATQHVEARVNGDGSIYTFEG